jgi:hypothetical protein
MVLHRPVELAAVTGQLDSAKVCKSSAIEILGLTERLKSRYCSHLFRIACISNREKPSGLPLNINHFQADLLKGFLNANFAESVGIPCAMGFGAKSLSGLCVYRPSGLSPSGPQSETIARLLGIRYDSVSRTLRGNLDRRMVTVTDYSSSTG